MEGYLKLYRQIIDSEIFASPNGLKIWIWCLCKASYKEKHMTIQIGRGESIVKLEVGSFLFGRFKAEQELDLSGSMIYRWIKRLEDLGMIKIISNSHYSIITICNWETYQENNSESEQPLNSQRTAVEQPLNTNKKDKKDKNIKKEIYKERMLGHMENENKDINKESITVNTKKEEKSDWRNSFEVYKQELKEAYKELINDEAYMKQRQGYHNNLDIPKSLEKACVDYWATEEGWAKKKKSKSKTIDWRSTFNNALSLTCNQVRK